MAGGSWTYRPEAREWLQWYTDRAGVLRSPEIDLNSGPRALNDVVAACYHNNAWQRYCWPMHASGIPIHEALALGAMAVEGG